MADLLLSYLDGLMTPLGAVCVLPLYPGYIALLAAGVREEGGRWATVMMGLLVTAGVMGGMFGFGLVVSAVFGLSISAAIGVVAPVLYTVLAAVGAAMVAGVDATGRIPAMEAPARGGAVVSALLFGAFFGLIALPCNPGPIVLLFALSASTTAFGEHLLLFGLEMATPLLALSLLPAGRGRSVTMLVARHHRLISRVTGLFLLVVAVSYLAATILA